MGKGLIESLMKLIPPTPPGNRDYGHLSLHLVAERALPPTAVVDAVHIAVAAVNGMDYLLTWNCTHIANAATRATIERACRTAGFAPPVICTPEELSED